MTQKQLADKLLLSDKIISKWETNRGLSDISILGDLSEVLGVSIAELLTENIRRNQNKSSNMLKSVFYICPVCENIVNSTGEGEFNCCGINLPKAEVEEEDFEHEIKKQQIGHELNVKVDHEMSKITIFHL